MSDIQQPMPESPPCPLCGGATLMKVVHKAVAAVTNVFKCTVCHVEYPVQRKDAKA